jgi:hypothetical protein
MVVEGKGSLMCFEIFAKHKINSYSGQLSYTYSRSWRRNDALENIDFIRTCTTDLIIYLFS